MALLQKFPVFDTNYGKLGMNKPLYKPKDLEILEFRTGGSLNAVIDRIREGGSFLLKAAPGSGKTTRFPGELAQITGKLVIHTFPFEHLAYAQFEHIKSRTTSVAVTYITDVDQPFPSTGWVICTASMVVAKWLQEAEVALADCFLLQDESHESGPASAALRSLHSHCRGVRSYVQMTATEGLEPARKMETGGNVYDMKFEPSCYKDPWDVDEDGAPWSVDQIGGDLLIFEDDKTRVEDLVQAYTRAHCHAFVLTASTTGKQFMRTMAQKKKDVNTPNIYIADSTFRSGHTFLVSTIIDSGFITRMVTDGDGIVKRRRPIFQFEREQTRARGGRLQKAVCTYWKPSTSCDRAICDLGQADAEAYALILRTLGYKPPKLVANAVMSSGSVPRNLADALNGPLPLALRKGNFVGLENLQKEGYRVSSVFLPEKLPEVSKEKEKENKSIRTTYTRQRSDVKEVKDAVNNTIQRDEVSTKFLRESMSAFDDIGDGFLDSVKKLSTDSEISELQKVKPALEKRSSEADLKDALDMSIFHEFLDQEKEKVEPTYGSYIQVEGAVTLDKRSVAYPEGALSVMRVMQSDVGGVAMACLDDLSRSVALNALADSYNKKMVELRAIVKAMKEAKIAAKDLDKDKLKKWAVQAAESYASLGSQAGKLFELMIKLRSEDVYVSDLSVDLDDEEDIFAKKIFEPLKICSQIDLGGDLKKDVTSWVKNVTSIAPQHRRISSYSSSLKDKDHSYGSYSFDHMGKNYSGFSPVTRSIQYRNVNTKPTLCFVKTREKRSSYEDTGQSVRSVSVKSTRTTSSGKSEKSVILGSKLGRVMARL